MASKHTQNSIVAQHALSILTLFWLMYYAWIYQTQLQYRPQELYEPLTWFGKLFIPSFPKSLYFYSVWLLGVVSALMLLFASRFKLVLKLLLIFSMLFVNSTTWSFGYLSHVAHHLILAQLLGLFLPSFHQAKCLPDTYLKSIFNWYYVGLLCTYSLSAIWKIETCIFDAWNEQWNVSWLHPKATANTVVGGYVWMHESIPNYLQYLLQFDVLWQTSFIITTFIMLLAPFSVISRNLFVITVVFLILFHIGNSVFFRAEFFVTPIMLCLFILPYHKLPIIKTYMAKAASK